ncbi:MAG: RloB domain-containing protein [Chloroflexi bacterium]|nr:MAG: RloB domain-containing protein [Chloroflexota bacterium]
MGKHRKRISYRRRVNYFQPRRKILIVCEGEKTEPNYFKKFKIRPDFVVKVEGVGQDPGNLIKETVRLKHDEKYDQVWCVFDKDEVSIVNFNRALQLAKRNNIQVAYSNEAFELWYLLHFSYIDTGISRKSYKRRLSEKRCLGHPYKKNSKTIFDELYAKQKDAINNAKRLLDEYQSRNPATDNPSTTVHLLVEQLNQLFWD